MSCATLRQRGCESGGKSEKTRSTHAGPSSTMKKVRKTIVTIPTTMLTTPLVTETAAPDSPSSFFAPPLLICVRTFSTTWYLVSRKPNRPLPFVTSST